MKNEKKTASEDTNTLLLIDETITLVTKLKYYVLYGYTYIKYHLV